MTPEEVEALDSGTLVKLVDAPNPGQDSPAIVGHGQPTPALTITVDGDVYQFDWGLTGQLSTKCDPDHKIANLEASGYPLFRKSFVRDHSNLFELVEQSSE